MYHYAIIPARAGSKGIINKNLQLIGNKSLVTRAIDTAKKANIFEKIILTTDIATLIKEYSKDKKVEVRDRPKELAQDDSLMIDVVHDVIYNCDLFREDNSYFWILQPTSPFRNVEHIKFIFKTLIARDVANVISVKCVGSNHPNRTYSITKTGYLKRIRFTNFNNRQDLFPLYIRNGCFYVCRIGTFKVTKSFDGGACWPFLMEEKHSINIDQPLDLLMAKAVYDSRAYE